MPQIRRFAVPMQLQEASLLCGSSSEAAPSPSPSAAPPFHARLHILHAMSVGMFRPPPIRLHTRRAAHSSCRYYSDARPTSGRSMMDCRRQ
jgi:hypothetical protein